MTKLEPCPTCGLPKENAESVWCSDAFHAPPTSQSDEALLEELRRLACCQGQCNLPQIRCLRDDFDRTAREAATEAKVIDAIAAMMAKVVDNWPAPKKLSTAIKLIDKTLDEMVSKETAEAREAAAYAKGQREGGEALRKAVAIADKALIEVRECAVNHYGSDYEVFGMPGWILDLGVQLNAIRALGEKQP